MEIFLIPLPLTLEYLKGQFRSTSLPLSHHGCNIYVHGHIYNLPDCVKSQVRLFADDCLLYRTINSQSDHLTFQKDLEALEKWASGWGMRFNAKKCYLMSFNSRSSHFYTLNNHILQKVKQNPYLGILISEDLKWEPHLIKISKKANSTLAFLKRNLRHCPEPHRRTAYISLVRSVLEYGSIVWDPYYVKGINRIETIQRQAVRFISGDYATRDLDVSPKCWKIKIFHHFKTEGLQLD